MASLNDSSLRTALESIVGPQNVLADEPLSSYTTFKIGGPAELLVKPSSPEEVVAVVAACRRADAPLQVLGLGSNVLVSDAGMPGVTVVLADDFAKIVVEGDVIFAQAGASNAAVAEAALEAGLAGYEFASGIPGTIGGAAIMNAGAYDGEFRDVCTEVTCLTPEGEVCALSAEEAQWSYRHSFMQDQGWIVLGARLALTPGNKEQIAAAMADLKQRREDKQPLEFGSAGSTFKRPEGYFAGKLIQDAGMRGHRVGDAQVSEKHCGFVINRAHATAADVRRCIADVQDAVFAMEGVRLEPEVRMWGFDD